MCKRIDHKNLPAGGGETPPAQRGVFTPCAAAGSLLKTQPAAAKIGGRIRFLFSGFSQFRDNPHLEEVYPPNAEYEFAPELLEEKFGAKSEPIK